jgi:hypothetical protein
MRQVTTKAKWTERIVYALSDDDKTFAVVSTTPSNPAGRVGAGRVFKRSEPAN